MRVVDAGVLVGVLVGDLGPEALGGEELAAPHLIDREVTHVLRRRAHQGELSDDAATAAMDGSVDSVSPASPPTGSNAGCGRYAITFRPTTPRT